MATNADINSIDEKIGQCENTNRVYELINTIIVWAHKLTKEGSI